MDEIAIESGVPLPTKETKKSRYPFARMNVGDSFLIEGAKNSSSYEAMRVRSAASHYARRDGKKFTVRVVEGGIRVWRVE